MSRFTAISIESAGWFCMSPENRRHNPSEICWGAAIVSYLLPLAVVSAMRVEAEAVWMGVWGKVGVILRGSSVG